MRLDLVFTILGQSFILGCRPEDVEEAPPGAVSQVELFGFARPTDYSEFFEEPTDPEA